MDNQLVLRSDNQIAEIKEFAQIMTESKIFKEGNVAIDMAQAFVKIQAGKELGIQPFQAMNSFEIIQGKIGIKPIALGALIKRSGKYDYKIIESTEKLCKIDFFENGLHLASEIFTFEMASNMGLTARDQWKKQPKNMLIWRCLAFGCRHHCPDIIYGTLYDVEEIKDIEYSPIYKNTVETPTQDAVVIEEKQVDDAYFLQSDEALEVINHWNIQYENCTSIDELLIVGDIIKEKLGTGEIDSRLTNILLKNYNAKGKSLKG
jgi:hypothetical protein